jgi:hypothetical protein
MYVSALTSEAAWVARIIDCLGFKHQQQRTYHTERVPGVIPSIFSDDFRLITWTWETCLEVITLHSAEIADADSTWYLPGVHAVAT